MGLPVCRIVVLIEIIILIRICGYHFPCRSLCGVCTIKWVGFDDLSTVVSQDPFARFARVFWKGDGHAVTACRAEHSICDSGIAASRVENRFVLCKLA